MRYLPILLVALFPLAVAGQNIVSAVAILVAAIVATRRGWRFSRPYFLDQHEISLLCFVAWGSAVTLYRGHEGAERSVFNYIMGFLPLLLLPPLLRAYFRPTERYWNLLLMVATTVAAVWATIAVSQSIWGWRISGSGLQWGYHRAQALYSHPLTFAYCMLLFWPLALGRVRFVPRSPTTWILFVSVALCLWLSESRTAQLVALLITVADVLLYARRLRIPAIVGIIAVCSYAVAGDHNLGHKIRKTFAGTEERNTEYADDRLVFWHAYSKLVAEAPIIGHGIDIPKAKVHEAYAAIGMQDFFKKYPAHNTYLQTCAETGIVGLLLFCWWILTYLIAIMRQRGTDPWVIFEWQAWIALLLAAMTQNAFQDSEVRYGVMLLCIYRSLRRR